MDETLKLILEVDTASGQASVRQFTEEYNRSKDEWTSGPREAAKANQGMISSFTDMYFAGKVAFDIIEKGVKTIWNLAEAADASQRATDRMGFSFKAVGYDFQALQPLIDEFADSFKKVDDEVIKQALGHMMQYTKDASQGMDGVKIAMDMTRQTGMDLESTVRVIGMAMNGDVEVAGRWIPELRDINEKLGEHATKAEKSAYAMDVFKEKFGGASEGVNSLKDKMGELNKEWGDWKKSIGGLFLPVAKGATDALTAIIRFDNEARKAMTDLFTPQDVTLEREKRAYEEWLRQKRSLKDAADRQARAKELAALGKQYEDQYKLDQEWQLKILQVEGNTLGQIEIMRQQDLEKARQAGLDIYQINLYYAQLKAQKEKEIEDKRVADFQKNIDDRIKIWEEYYGKIQGRVDEAAKIGEKYGVETTAGMASQFKEVEEDWRKFLSGATTRDERDQVQKAMIEWVGTLKETLGEGKTGGMFDATVKNVETIRREFDVMTGTAYSVQFDDKAVIETVYNLQNIQNWLKAITEKRWEINLQVNSDSIAQIDRALANMMERGRSSMQILLPEE
jgi:hypothetical protein